MFTYSVELEVVELVWYVCLFECTLATELLDM